MSPRKHEPKPRTNAERAVNKSFLYLLNGRLRHAPEVPKYVTKAGGLSLRTLALLSHMRGDAIDNDGRTTLYRPDWFPQLEVLSHVSLHNHITQVALRTTVLHEESGLLVRRVERHSLEVSEILLGGMSLLPEEAMRFPEHPKMAARQDDITKLTQNFLNTHILLTTEEQML